MSMPSFGTGPVGPMSLSDDLDLRESLGTRSGQVVLRYSVTPRGGRPADADPDTLARARRAPPRRLAPATVGPLRAFTLTAFDGTTWDRADSLDLTTWDPATLLSSDPDDPRHRAGRRARHARRTSRSRWPDLRERRLPVSTFPRTVDVERRVGVRRRPRRGRRPARHVRRHDVRDAGRDPLAHQGRPRRRGGRRPRTTTARPSRCRRPPHRRTSPTLAREITADATTAVRAGDGAPDVLPRHDELHLRHPRGTVAVRRRRLGLPAVDPRVLRAVRHLDGDHGPHARHPRPRRRRVPARRVRPQRQLRRHRPADARLAGAVLRGLRLGPVRADPRRADERSAALGDPFTGVSAPDSQPDEIVPLPASSASSSTAPGGQSSSTGTQDEDQAWLPVAITVAIVLVVASLALALVRRRSLLRADLTPERAWLRARRRLGARGVTWTDADSPRTVVASVHEQLRQAAGAPLTGDVRRGAGVVGQDRRARALRAGPARGGPGRPGRVGRRHDERRRDAAQRPLSPRRRSQRSSRRDMKLDF